MRILLSSESYWPNKDGGAVFEHRLVHQLMRGGHDVCVVTPGKKWVAYDEEDNGYVIYRTPSAPLPFNKDAYRVTYYANSQVKKALNQFKPDIIHVNTMALTGTSLMRHAKKRNIPIVATNHLMPENVLMSLPEFIKNSQYTHRLFWRTIIRFHNKFQRVSSPTESAIKLLDDYGLTRPLFAISNGVDTDWYKPKQSSTSKENPLLKRFNLPKKRYILYLGRVNAEKRLDMLIDSFTLVAKKDKDVCLVIAGKGNRLDFLKQYAAKLGLEKRIVFTGLVSDDEKLALLQNAILYAITSPAELQSIATLEAMACGLPIVAVDIVALHELCHEGKNGFLVELDDIEGCAKAILKITSDTDLQKRFGDYSRALVVDKHSHESSYQQFLNFYESALREHYKG